MSTTYETVLKSAEYVSGKMPLKRFANRHINKDTYCLIEYKRRIYLLRENTRNLTPGDAPALCRLIQDDGLMGRYNKLTLPEYCGSLILVSKIENNKVMADKLDGRTYLRFEVVADYCPPGSNFWALYKMSEGKAITHSSFPDGYYYKMSPGYNRYHTVCDIWGNKHDAVSFTHGSLQLYRHIKGGKVPNDGKSVKAIGGNIYFKDENIPSSWEHGNGFKNIVMCGYKYQPKAHSNISIGNIECSKNNI